MFSLRLTRIPANFRTCLQIRKHSSAVQVAQDSENSLVNVSEDEVKYPEILDLSFPAKQRRKYEKHCEYIKRQKTVEEKQIALNMPRYYGFPIVELRENLIHYNSQEQTQFLTRTHIMDSKGLPSFYNDLISPETLDQIVANIRNQIEEVLVLEYSQRNIKSDLPAEVLSEPEKLLHVQTTSITRQINRILLMELSSKFPHLLEAEIDYDPRIEAFWVVGGMEPPKSVKLSKRKLRWQRPYSEDPIDRYFQYFGEPSIQLRHALPLREVVPYEESENENYTVPEFKYDPLTIGLYKTRRHGTSIPGFWPGDTREFGLLSYHRCSYMARRPEEYDDEESALTTQAIRASYAWLHGQASYQGFSTYNDVTYPLVTQNVILNGQWWFFSVYQLNTTLFSDHHIDDNPKRNFYWTTGPMQLFEKIEGDKVHGLNDEVLKHLVKLYVNQPQKREVEMKPYLGKEEKVLADIKDVAKRRWLEKMYKQIMSCRPRHRAVPEIYNWEQIYIRRFKQRPMETIHTPWQRGKNMMTRKLDEHAPKYIPKCLRPYPRSKAKFEKTYYPE